MLPRPNKRTIVWLADERPQGCFRVIVWFAVLGVVALVIDGCAGHLRPNTPGTATPTGHELAFTATAYCTGTITASATKPTEETVAADPAVLPMGSRIKLGGLATRYNRVYVVLDTGRNIRGRRIDLFMRDCQEAVAFGRRSVKVSILR
jgi:3D (Asp-Asp-Asp) domain-containing protein